METKRSTDTDPTDGELVRAVLAGQPDAFESLVERYQRRATSVAYRLLGNLHDALEVSQEAFIRAYRNLDTLEKQDRFGSWFLRIVSNLSLNYRRSRRSGVPKVSLEDCILDEGRSSSDLVGTPEHADTHPEARVLAAELSQVVQDAIGQLPEQQRLALVLFSIEQLPQKEVAGIMNCSVEAVKWHVFQARKTLRVRLAEHL